MRLAPRTTLVMLLVAGTPLGLLGWSAMRLAEDALRERTAALHQTVAGSVADRLDEALQARVRAVQQAANAFEFDTLSGDPLQGALRLTFRQVPDAAVVALLDAEARQVAPPVHLDRPAGDPALRPRPVVDKAGVAAFARQIPFQAARTVGAAVGQPYLSPGGAPRLAVAARAGDTLTLAVELTLEPLTALLGDPRSHTGVTAFVVDGEGRVLLHPDPAVTASGEDRSDWAPVAAALTGTPVPAVFDAPGMGSTLGATQTVQPFGWTVVVAEPEDTALAAARQVGRRTFGVMLAALAAAAALGVVLTRRVLTPVRTLHAGALALSAGDLDHRVAGADRPDELGEVARAFNAMAGEVQRWNTELERRVEAKAREVREAQELLVRSQKLAAVGELGAGVSHEINNPLAGLLGLCQLTLAEMGSDDPRRARLQSIEQQALRIREIVENLRRLTRSEEAGTTHPTDLAEVLDGALSLVESQLQAQGIRVVRDYHPQVQRIPGNPDQLAEAFVHLISNARHAMPDGGRLTLQIESPTPQLVVVRISDTGVGVPKDLQARIFDPFFTDKKDWRGTGLGLTLVNRIVEAHSGRITVDSEPGQGATFTLLFPAALQRALA